MLGEHVTEQACDHVRAREGARVLPAADPGRRAVERPGRLPRRRVPRDVRRASRRVFRLSSALRSRLGLARGDRFAVMAGNSHQFLELYHAGFLGAGVVNPLNLRLAPEGARSSSSPTRARRSCFIDPFFAERHRPGARRRRHRAGRADRRRRRAARRRLRGAARARRRRRSPTSPRRTTRSSSCTRAARPDCPRACCSTSGPRCSTCTTSARRGGTRRGPRLPAPDADVPRRVDGRRCSACPRERRSVGVRAAVRPGRGARR